MTGFVRFISNATSSAFACSSSHSHRTTTVPKIQPLVYPAPAQPHYGRLSASKNKGPYGIFKPQINAVKARHQVLRSDRQRETYKLCKEQFNRLKGGEEKRMRLAVANRIDYVAALDEGFSQEIGNIFWDAVAFRLQRRLTGVFDGFNCIRDIFCK